MLKLRVERGEPTLVPPMEHACCRGTDLYFLSNFNYNFPRKMSTAYCFTPMDDNRGNYEDKPAVEVMKNALLKVLVPYYPMAGRLTIGSDGRPAVACTSEGAVFVEAEASCKIEEIGDDTVLMEELVYDTSAAIKRLLDLPPLSAQVIMFCPVWFEGIRIPKLTRQGQSLRIHSGTPDGVVLARGIGIP